MTTEWVTTSTLLQQLRDFDNDSVWREFVDRFHRPILAFAAKLGVDPSEVDDVAQESLADFADAFRNGQYDREKGRLSRWLFGIAYHRAARRRRKSARERRHRASEDVSAYQELPDEAAASTMWDHTWKKFVLGQCIERVRPEFRPELFQAFELLVWQERSPGEVAEELGLSVKQVYNAKHRILQRVRAVRVSLESMEPPVPPS